MGMRTGEVTNFRTSPLNTTNVIELNRSINMMDGSPKEDDENDVASL